MIPVSDVELDRVSDECRAMVNKRAALSGLAAAVPVPGVEIAADVGLLMELLPAINRRFGLAPDQIDGYDAQRKMVLYNLIIEMGSKAVGKVITEKLVLRLLTIVGIRVSAASVAKFIPVVGQLTAAGLSFAAMKYLANAHITECRTIVKRHNARPRLTGDGPLCLAFE